MFFISSHPCLLQFTGEGILSHYISCSDWVRRIPHFQTKGNTHRAVPPISFAGASSCRSFSFVQSLSSAELLGCLKLNKNAKVCKVKAQEAFKSEDCDMLLPGQNNLGHLLLNKRSTAIIVPSTISSNNNQKNLLVQGNYKTTT